MFRVGKRRRKRKKKERDVNHCTSACLHCNAGGCANGNATCSHLVGRFKDGYGSPLAAATAAATFFVPFPLLRGDLPAPFGFRADFAFTGAAFGAAAVPVDLRAATIYLPAEFRFDGSQVGYESLEFSSSAIPSRSPLPRINGFSYLRIHE